MYIACQLENQEISSYETFVIVEVLGNVATVIFEGVKLGEVPAGVYILSAAHINLVDCDGEPC